MIWSFGSLGESKWYMIEASVLFKLLPTSILDLYKVFDPLLCCLRGMWAHPYTIPPAKLAPDLELLGCLWSGNDAITSCVRLIYTSDHIVHPYYIFIKCLSYNYAVSRAYGCTLIPFHRPSRPQLWNFLVACGVEMMTLRHVWGWFPPQTTLYIHIR